ncbi:MAG: 3'-5' exonuclease [Bacteroidales bacterium]|nr:3'-5' exonuclease [Bacteroidales bacterium]
MNLKLKRPLAFFDLESTGLNVVSDRIVEIAILKVHPDGKEELYRKLINPTIPMSKEASAITGIKDEDLKDMPLFKDLAKEIAHFLDNCDLAGFNSNKFDLPLLAEEFLRTDVDFDMSKRKMIDVQVIFHKKEQRTLSAAYQFYCEKELENAHSADADTIATFEVLKAQLDKYDDIENDVEKLANFSSHNNNVDFAGRIVKNGKGEPVFNFGKYKGKIVTEVLKKDPAYYGWMMNADFPLYTKKILTKIKLSMSNMLKGGLFE